MDRYGYQIGGEDPALAISVLSLGLLFNTAEL